ncbi:MAG: hypothetical protein K9N47_20280 [Prosthecobacter sp.]|uniref:hypothetical protein n=1 Tax=Prosthecobacter sp. TaxID=1965333 RepID=UPI0026029ACA|nr:hypothetical protein [Prosthecobacter sp.]MCF7788470.1 hypothetical protein [Prosthecobacter sp.]
MGKAATPSLPIPSLSPRGKAPKPVWFWPAIILSSTVCVLLGVVFVYMSATATSRSGTQGTAETKSEEKPTQAKLRPASVTGKEIFPSALISTATVDWNGDEQSAEDKKTDEDAQLRKHQIPIYGDENGWLGVNLEGLKIGMQVSVEVAADGFMKSSKWQGTITTLSDDGRATIFPKVMWDYDALTKVRQQRPINVIFSASIDGSALQEVTETYTLRSINDCLFYIKGDKSGNNGTNLDFLFAAYVNEKHPQVQEILKEALETGLVPRFDGYGSKDPKQVLQQIFSIWNALQRRGIKYSNEAFTTPSEAVYCQTVRFMDQSINSHQANCVDGSVLMASVLYNIGIKSHLVMIPGHCFLAFDLTPHSTSLPVGLETTLLGNDDITDVKNLGFLPEQKIVQEYTDSVKTFNQAMASGDESIQRYARKLQSGDDPQFGLISVEEARKKGIMAIPFTMDK